MRNKNKTLIPTFSRKREKGPAGAGLCFLTLSRLRERAG
jgi:hypothetical protein